eukprot:g2751.t1
MSSSSEKGGETGKRRKKAGNKIVVGIRCRPLNKKEKELRNKCIWKFPPGGNTVEELEDDGQKTTGKKLHYDHVFSPKISTEEVYNKQCKPIIEGAVDGYNGTIFAYGQTSSGKTFTLMGDPDSNPGVTIRAIKDVFEHCSKNPQSQWNIHVAYIEIYNESITDLLQRDPKRAHNLKVIEDKVFGPDVKGLTEVRALNPQHCLDVLADGEKRRSFAATDMNATSSRSHTLFRMRIESMTVAGHQHDETVANMRSIASDLEAARNDMGADRCSLYLVDKETDELFIQAGDITLRLPMSLGIAGAVATEGKTINIRDAYRDKRFNSSVDKSTGYHTKTILTMPVNGQDGSVVGVVQFINKSGGAFDKDDEKRVQSLVSKAGPIIQLTQAMARTSTLSRLNLVDLAGSERASKTGATGALLKEGANINRSLMMLGTCISMLSEGSKGHIPFRNSKLTRLLSTSLGGNARTCIICAFSPAARNRHETVSTMQFASRAKKIVNKAQKNQKKDTSELTQAYEEEIARLKAQIAEGTGKPGNEITEEQRQKMEEEKAYLMAQHDEMKDELEAKAAAAHEEALRAQEKFEEAQDLLKKKEEENRLTKRRSSQLEVHLSNLKETKMHLERHNTELSMRTERLQEAQEEAVASIEGLRDRNIELEKLVIRKDERIAELEAEIEGFHTTTTSLTTQMKQAHEERLKVDMDAQVSQSMLVSLENEVKRLRGTIEEYRQFFIDWQKKIDDDL